LPEATVAVTVQDALRSASAVLERAGSDTSRLDAELLLASALGVGRERLVLDAARDVDPAVLVALGRLVARRCAHEPVAYILGRKEFRHITLMLDDRVLIPRPETELLVEVGLTLPGGARVLDVGTGSGAVALALKDERPDLEVSGSDVSAGAVAVASENARRLGLEVRFAQADLLDGAPAGVDAVLANLPYVSEGSPLAPELSYEPRSALFAGADGLDVIRRLATMLADVPLVALEVGGGEAPEAPGEAPAAPGQTFAAPGQAPEVAAQLTGAAAQAPAVAAQLTGAAAQAPAVAALLQRTGFQSIEVLRDLAGHERVVVGRR
jgi:release factor glutamine methyltransferase